VFSERRILEETVFKERLKDSLILVELVGDIKI